MLTAINPKNGRTIVALQFDDIRSEYPDYVNLVDPLTGKPVFPRRAHLRNGARVQAHFVSTAILASDWPADLLPDIEYARIQGSKLTCNERLEHILGKLFIVQHTHEIQDPYCKPHRAEYEKIILLPTGKRRIIDVAFTLPSGDIIAHEMQLSRIDPDELEERSEDYRSVGIDVTWWFGLQAKTDKNIEWYREYFGGYPPTIDFRNNVATLYDNMRTEKSA